MKWIKNEYDQVVFIAFKYSTPYGSGYASGYLDDMWRSGFSSSQYGEETTPPVNWKRGFLEHMFEEGFEELIEDGNVNEFIKDLDEL